MSWNHFHKIVCINLARAQDRRERCEQHFETHHIPASFFPAIEKKDGNYGCFLSHRTLIRDAIEQDLDNILIFEDDIQPTKHCNPDALRHCVRFMETINYDIFYLGVVPDIRNYTTEVVTGHIYKVRGICTHAYVISRRGLHKLKDLRYSFAQPLDYKIRDNMDLECYGYYPSMFYQETDYKLPQWSIHLGMGLIEWYAWNINIPLRVLLDLLLGLAFGILSLYNQPKCAA